MSPNPRQQIQLLREALQAFVGNPNHRPVLYQPYPPDDRDDYYICACCSARWPCAHERAVRVLFETDPDRAASLVPNPPEPARSLDVSGHYPVAWGTSIPVSDPPEPQ